MLTSTYATARSGIVEILNTNCLNALNNRKIKGNASVTGGKAGERKRKWDDSAYEEKMYKKRVDGYVRAEQAIKLIFERNKKIQDALTESNEKQQRWNDLRADLSDNVKQFKEERVSEKVVSATINQATLSKDVRCTGLCPLLLVLEVNFRSSDC